jgi:hypothetical protein
MSYETAGAYTIYFTNQRYNIYIKAVTDWLTIHIFLLTLAVHTNKKED